MNDQYSQPSKMPVILIGMVLLRLIMFWIWMR